MVEDKYAKDNQEQRAITTLDDELAALRVRQDKLAVVKEGIVERLLVGRVRLV